MAPYRLHLAGLLKLILPSVHLNDALAGASRIHWLQVVDYVLLLHTFHLNSTDIWYTSIGVGIDKGLFLAYYDAVISRLIFGDLFTLIRCIAITAVYWAWLHDITNSGFYEVYRVYSL